MHVDAGGADRVAATFKMLGDPTRFRLLQALDVGGELSVGDLAAAAGIQESAVSHALRLLRTAGMVQRRREGRRVVYALDDEFVARLLRVSLRHDSSRRS